MEKIRNSRILLLFLLLLYCLIASCTKNELSSKTYTVGVVNLNENLEKVFWGFKKNLGELGYQEGSNITYIYNGPRSKMSDLENDLQSFVNQKVDLILSITTPATRKAKLMTANTGIPVVFAPVFDPVDSGIVQSLLKPGGNMTGIKAGGSSGKALRWLLKIAPETKNIFIPFNRNNKATVQSLQDFQAAAEKLGVQLSVTEVTNNKELTSVFDNLPSQVDAIWLLNSHFLVKHIALFVETAVRHKLPLGSNTSRIESGVLITYGQDAFRTGEMAADLAHKIFQGIPPASLPVEITDFFLGVNLKTANAIGIDISDDILHVAYTIIRP